jgi:hypothetical protein
MARFFLLYDSTTNQYQNDIMFSPGRQALLPPQKTETEIEEKTFHP